MQALNCTQSIHGKKLPGGRLPITSSALKNESISALRTKLKEFSQNLKVFAFKWTNNLLIHSSEQLCNLHGA